MKIPRIIHILAQKIDRWHWLILLLSSPLLLFPGSWKTLALLVVPILWINALIAGRNPLPNTPLNLALLIFTIMMLISLYETYDIEVSLPKIAGMILGLGVFYAFVTGAGRTNGLWMGLLFFFATGLGVAGIGFLGTNWLDKYGFMKAVTSHLPFLVKGLPGAETGFQPNEVAGGLLWLLPILLILPVTLILNLKKYTRTSGKRWVVTAIMLLLVFAGFSIGELFLTQSRGGIAGLAGSLVLLLVLVFPSKKRWIVWASLGGMGILLGLTAWQLGWFQKLSEAYYSGGNSALSLDTLKMRVEIWNRAISGIQDFPMTGMGMNTFRKVVNVLYPMFTVGPNVDIGHAHNEFLQAALDLGLPGLISFVSINLLAVWMLIQTWTAKSLTGSGGAILTLESGLVVRGLVLGLGGGLLAHALFGLTDAVALGAKPGVLFWMLLGLITGLYMICHKRLVSDG